MLATCYAAFLLAPAPLQAEILYRYAFIPADYSGAAAWLGPQGPIGLALPFLTYIFLHGGLSHLTINCIWLLPFGALVARRYHAALFFVFFLICGAAGRGHPSGLQLGIAAGGGGRFGRDFRA